MPSRLTILTALLLVLVSPLAVASMVHCRVVGGSDGDTLTCLTADRQQVRTRLAEIDAPESRQPYGSRAKQALSELAFGKQVVLQVQDTDRYGRSVARVLVSGADGNAELVRQGAGWFCRWQRRRRKRRRHQLQLLCAEGLQPDDFVRRGALSAGAVRQHQARWQRGWGTVREFVPVMGSTGGQPKSRLPAARIGWTRLCRCLPYSLA